MRGSVGREMENRINKSCCCCRVVVCLLGSVGF